VRDEGDFMALSIQLDQNPDFWILTARGDLDYSECATFRMTIDRILKHLPASTIVDLSALEYLDSSGLGLLLSLSKEYSAQGGHLVLVSNESVDNILDLTRLSGLFSCATSVEEAHTMLADLAE
jgi:anti-anti-sigma factor